MKLSNSTAKLHLVTSSSDTPQAQGDTRANPKLSLAATHEVSDRLNYITPDPALTAEFERELMSEQNFERLAELLNRVDTFPTKSISLDCVQFAAQRLTQADSELLRFSAYRRLAALHHIDFRYENKARLFLRNCLSNENGFARRQLERLLKHC